MFGFAVGTVAGGGLHGRDPEQRVGRTPPGDTGAEGDGPHRDERDAERVHGQHPAGTHQHHAGDHPDRAIPRAFVQKSHDDLLLPQSTLVTSPTGAPAIAIVGTRWIPPVSEFAIRQLRSAFSSNWRARAGSVPVGTSRRARTSNPTNRVVRSTRSRVPVTSQTRDVQATPAARATARKVRIRQSPTAATSRVSGDHRSPGPSNGVGDADGSVGNPSPWRSTAPVSAPLASIR